jgi:hypothetical protein
MKSLGLFALSELVGLLNAKMVKREFHSLLRQREFIPRAPTISATPHNHANNEATNRPITTCARSFATLLCLFSSRLDLWFRCFALLCGRLDSLGPCMLIRYQITKRFHRFFFSIRSRGQSQLQPRVRNTAPWRYGRRLQACNARFCFVHYHFESLTLCSCGIRLHLLRRNVHRRRRMWCIIV